MDAELHQASAALERASRMFDASTEFRELYPDLERALDRVRTSDAVAAAALLDDKMLPLLARTRIAICAVDLPAVPEAQLAAAEISQACQLARTLEDTYRDERAALAAGPLGGAQRDRLKAVRGYVVSSARVF